MGRICVTRPAESASPGWAESVFPGWGESLFPRWAESVFPGWAESLSPGWAGSYSPRLPATPAGPLLSRMGRDQPDSAGPGSPAPGSVRHSTEPQRPGRIEAIEQQTSFQRSQDRIGTPGERPTSSSTSNRITARQYLPAGISKLYSRTEQAANQHTPSINISACYQRIRAKDRMMKTRTQATWLQWAP